MKNTIPAVEKTMATLAQLADMPDGAPQATLQQATGTTASTAYRILQTLMKHDWVRKRQDGHYELSHGLLPLLLAFRQRLEHFDHAQSILDRLAAENDIACKLSIRQDNEQLTLLRAEPDAPITLTGRSGSRFPLIEGTVGAALLSQEDDKRIAELIHDCPAAIAEKEQPELVFNAVRDIRRHGYAVNIRKNRWNIAAMSTPISNADGAVIAALTLIGLESDFQGKKRHALARRLLHAAAECRDCVASTRETPSKGTNHGSTD
ncbi:MAG: IclR family transcriptional regulator [Lentisphaerae bacterium]|nr:IclR family transcriptional regulator [Lentisphaerota bacterium]